MTHFKQLTDADKIGLCSAICDLETGNYLIRPRTEMEIKYIQEILVAEHAKNPTERQKEIIEWRRACTDHEYAEANGYLDKTEL